MYYAFLWLTNNVFFYGTILNGGNITAAIRSVKTFDETSSLFT